MEARKKNILVLSGINFLKGIVFGMANIVPGVSGGTIAVVMGIYEGIISSLNTAFKGKKQFAAALLYLLPIALGALVGIFGFARFLSYCLEKFSLPTNIFFVGLIAGTIPGLIFIIYPALKKKGREKGNGEACGKPENGKPARAGFKPWHILPFAIAAAVITALAFVTPQGAGLSDFAPWQYAVLPLVGFAAAVVMMIPGVSGSFFLVLIGWYGIILEAIRIETLNIAVIGLFGIGAVLGILAAARIIDFLFRHMKTITYLAILGLVTGCIASIFIWPDTYNTGTGTWGIVTGVVLGLAGAALALVLGYSSGKGLFTPKKGAQEQAEENCSVEKAPQEQTEENGSGKE